MPETAPRTRTREMCQRCNHVSAVGFFSPVWELVTGPHWEHSILCIRCFAELGDEKFIEWEEDIEFYPVSFRTHVERTVKDA